MINKVSRNEMRKERHERVRSKIVGTNEVPRLCVFRSNTNIYAQIINDLEGITLVSASSLENKGQNGSNIEAAKLVGESLAKKAKTEAVINFQFAGKSYTTDDLVRIAKDVWKYDLNQKEADFKTVELYVKPEESLAYYVINGKFTGNFFI